MVTSDVIEVCIETLQGTAFELLVSPADTVVSIKCRISRLEGIPVSQQHLIWKSQELPDDCSLQECNITDGATIKLVLAMRGGPVNIRKAYLEERSTLQDVAKYLDTTGEEVSLCAPRLRAVRLVVMRDGERVHLYTVLDTTVKTPSGLLRCSEDHTAPELSDEDSASESRRHLENQITRRKVQQLQKKMRNLRLQKEDQRTPAPERAKAIAPPPKALLPPIEAPKPQAPVKQDRNAATAGNARAPAVVPRNLLRSSNVPVFGKKKAGRALGSGMVLPRLPTTSGCSRTAPRHWRYPSLIPSGSHASHNLPPPVARANSTGAVPKRTERNTGALHGRASAGFQARCRKYLLLATLGPADSSSSPCASLPEEGGAACAAEPTRYEVRPPLGLQEQAFLPRLSPDCERELGQDLAAAVASIFEPLDLDWSDFQPRASPRLVRVSVVQRSKTTRPIVSPPYTPDKGRACNAKAPTGAVLKVTGGSAPPSSVPVKPVPLASGPPSPRPAFSKPLRPVSPATLLEMPPAALDACRKDLVDALKPPPPPSDNTVPTSNGPPSGNPERSSGSSADASDSTVTASSVGTLPAESSASAGSMSADSAGMAGSASGSNVALSVDVGAASSGELSTGNGAELMPVPVDEDSNSTSESKTDDMPMDPLHPLGKAKKKGKRCSWCKRKTGLASTYVCRCGNTFCTVHRYAEAHACSHDYKAEGRHILQRNNPVVKAAKLPKI
nr:SH3 domain-containing protein C23A1.17-like isoform X5 [Rhipicephalus microplus]